jgi:hypothetical protein
MHDPEHDSEPLAAAVDTPDAAVQVGRWPCGPRRCCSLSRSGRVVPRHDECTDADVEDGPGLIGLDDRIHVTAERTNSTSLVRPSREPRCQRPASRSGHGLLPRRLITPGRWRVQPPWAVLVGGPGGVDASA